MRFVASRMWVGHAMTQAASPTRGRLLPFALHDAAANMAIDEAIAEAVALKDVAPTLRFYGWSRPTLSLGYFQSLNDATPWSDRTGDVASEADGTLSGIVDDGRVDIVRRSTGGGAILHHFELTYSLSLPLNDTGPGARECVYQTVHQCVIESLADVGVAAMPYRDTAAAAEKLSRDAVSDSNTGLRSKRDEPFLCFQRRTDEDLICGGYKIAGSAQRRVRGGVLQHGSLLLRVSRHAPSLPGINELSSVAIEPHEIEASIAAKVGTAMGIDWQSGNLTDSELDASERIRQQRYAAAEWTGRR
ncbi:biotin/lipoate A/B protein ligase family protein [Rhodopirellula sp. SWK7]|uniref:lipoate--protein ligase family protein n=1 Tax=Rhodopirellula sp. SWK7 TaxID=595460 RepID=UPI00034A1DBD|nr:biotin/lipoate A/B protein ligase family protein [Rhodopirellula sp. SWK7]